MPDDKLDKAFLAELEALEKFRISYTGLFPKVPLAREDPDVRRLIEAMAMFTARTRLAAERNVGNALLHLFRQYFSYLVQPLPAMTMLRAQPTARYVDVAELPRDTEVLLIRKLDDREEVLRFRTLAKLRVLPIELDAVEISGNRTRGWRLLLRFSSAFPRNDEIGDLNLHVNHLNDLQSSLTVLHELRSHLRGASVVFGRTIAEDAPGSPCEVRFGPLQDADGSFEHPLQRARAQIRFPHQALFLGVTGIQPPRNWQHFAICLDLDAGWPVALRLTRDAFQLHVVPVVNLRRDMADPMECDGTKERYPVRHPDPAGRWLPYSVDGVYRMTPEGLVPLEPAVVGTGRASYDVIPEGKGDARRTWLSLHLPHAFDAPERIAVDATWYQPLPRDVSAADFDVRLGDRLLDGVAWSSYGALVGPRDSELEDDREALLHLLSMKNKRFLGASELTQLLHALGVDREPHYKRLVSAIASVNVESKPFVRRSHGFKYVYEIEFERLDRSDLPNLDQFCRELLGVLGAWSVEEVVELVAVVRNLEKRLHYA